MTTRMDWIGLDCRRRARETSTRGSIEGEDEEETTRDEGARMDADAGRSDARGGERFQGEVRRGS